MTVIAIVNYGMGNFHSVARALRHAAPHADVRVCDRAADIASADRVVFPGQGAMADCMRTLDESGLRDAVVQAAANKPLLGICVGEQMLFTRSQEGDQVIICATTHITHPAELYTTRPTILTFGHDNIIQEVMHYEVKKTTTRDFDFSVHSSGHRIPEERKLHSVNIAALAADLKSKGLDDLAIADLVAKHLGQSV